MAANLAVIEKSIQVHFSGTIYGVEAYKWMEMTPAQKEEQIRKFTRKVDLIKNMCLRYGVNGVHELSRELRKELRQGLMRIGNIRKCSNCRYYYLYHDMPIEKAKDLIEAYILRKKPEKKDKISELMSINDYKNLRKFIEENMDEYKNALIGVIFNIGPYCDKLKACIKEQSMAISCRYFLGR